MKAILVPGQGKHTVELADVKWPEVLSWYKNIETITNTKISEKTINQHEVNSLCILGNAFGHYQRFVESNNALPEFVCGYSIGQYAALSFSGVLSFEECLDLVLKRSELMINSKINNMGMLSVLGLDLKILEELIYNILSPEKMNDHYFIEISNFNSPFNYTVAGNIDLLIKLEKNCIQSNCKKCELVPVEGAWHSRMLKSVSGNFEELLQNYSFNEPKIKYIDNYSGNIERDVETIKKNLVRHLYSPVNWDKTMETLIDNEVTDCFVAGPGNQIQTMFLFKTRKMILHQMK